MGSCGPTLDDHRVIPRDPLPLLLVSFDPEVRNNEVTTFLGSPTTVGEPSSMFTDTLLTFCKVVGVIVNVAALTVCVVRN